MESKRLVDGGRCRGSNRRRREAIGHALLFVLLLKLVALNLQAQPAAGSIVTHSIPVAGLSVIDSQQNVYIAAGGSCAGGFNSIVVCNPIEIAKVDPLGHVVFSTLVGGPDANGPQTAPLDLAVDSAGNTYVVGTIYTPLPTTPNAAQPTGPAGGAFAAKLSADGSKFLYLTYLPAALWAPAAIRVDAQGNAYIAGTTLDSHAFLTKLNAAGTAFVYSKRLAGSAASSTNPDSAYALAVDETGNAVVTGRTGSPDFPVTAGVLEAKLPAAPSAFVTKFDADGNIVFSTFLGGAGGAYGQAVQMDAAGSIYVAGAAGAGFPTTPGTYEPTAVIPLWSEGTVGFIAKIEPDASAVNWATYTVPTIYPPSSILLALSATGDAYLALSTGAGFQTTASAPQPCYGGGFDVVVVHLNASGGLADATYLGAYQSLPMGLSIPGDGSVLVAATLPPCSQGVSVCATANNGPVMAQIRFGEAGWSAPSCLSSDVVNSATFVSNGFLSPGEFVSLTGFGIGPESGVVYQPGPQGQAPLSLGGVQLSFNGIPAPLTYVQSRQINAQVPFEVNGTTASFTLTYNDTKFGPYVMGVGYFAPQGIFRLQPGVSTQAAAINQDGSVNGPSNPASRGSVVSLFGTGYGPLNPPCETGALNPPGPVPLYYTGPIFGNGPNVGVGSNYPEVLYAGSAPTLLCGIVQINIQVPSDASPGPFMLLSDSAGVSTGSTIYVQ